MSPLGKSKILLGSFQGSVSDFAVELRVYSSHLELALELPKGRPVLAVEMEEVATVVVDVASTMTTLSIDDISGVRVVSLVLDTAHAEAARALIERAKRG